MFDGLLVKLAIRRIGDILFPNRCIHPHFLHLFANHVGTKQVNALPEDLLHSFFPDPVPEMNKVARIKGRVVLKVDLTTKVLSVRVFKIPKNNCLITQVVHLFQEQ